MGRTPAKSVLVTGGFGFIGSHLVEMLLKKQDVHVHVVDNMVTSPIHPRLTWSSSGNRIGSAMTFVRSENSSHGKICRSSMRSTIWPRL